MSATILPFTVKRPGGTVYVVFSKHGDEPGDWLVYSQAAGADEPDLEGLHADVEAAVRMGRRLAVARCSLFILDEGGRT